MRRPPRARLALALLALVAAVVNPVMALAHGQAHARESAEHVGVHAARAPGVERAPMVEASDDGDADHPVLHFSTAAKSSPDASAPALAAPVRCAVVSVAPRDEPRGPRRYEVPLPRDVPLARSSRAPPAV